MRGLRWMVLACVPMLALLGSCRNAPPATARTAPMVGAWELVSARYTTPGKPPQVLGATDLHALKVISPTRFSFVAVRADGSFYAAGGGDYQVRGDAHAGSYTENVVYGSVPSMVGKGYPFSYRIEGTRWYHEGEEDGVHVEEVWQRVDR